MPTIEDVLRSGVASAAELASQLQTSQPTLSRRIREANNLLKMGQGKATRYALVRNISRQNGVLEKNNFPLYRINNTGQAERMGTLFPIWPGESCAVQSANGKWLLYEGLPWYLTDRRPQGFLGRAWGRAIGPQLGLPEDIRYWSETYTLLALAQWGSDSIGDVILGESAYQTWFSQPTAPAVSLENKLEHYQHLAALSMAGEQVGSSAGGEQPKFTCYVEQVRRPPAHVLVKFSSTLANDNSQRWSDLLQAEAIALALLQEHGVLAATAEMILGEGTAAFLQVERFDRIGERGRLGVVSLESVVAEFSGRASFNWVESARHLLALKIIDVKTFERIGQIYAFGKLIANSDMHQGNLSFVNPEHFPLQLAPVYDMLPMSFAPLSSRTFKLISLQWALNFCEILHV